MAAPDVGETVPELTMPLADAEGRTHVLAGAIKAGPVLLGIYKYSCQASKTIFPFLERLHQRHPVDQLTVLGVAQDSANISRSFVRRYGITFPILIEPTDYPVSRAFDIFATPTVFLIRPDGTVAFTTMGFFKGPINDLGDAVAAELGVPPSPLFTEADVAVPIFVPG